MKQIKHLTLLLSLICLVLFIAGCGKKQPNEAPQELTVGILSDTFIWKQLVQDAQEKNISISLKKYPNSNGLNKALAAKEIDIAGSQTISAFDQSVKEKNLNNLVAVASSYWAPMGLYSEKYTKITQLKSGDTIALPKDPTDLGRALVMLNEAKLIKLSKEFDGIGSLDKITSNTKKLTFDLIDVDTIKTPLKNYEAVILPNESALKYHLDIYKDALTIEVVVPKPYVSILATRTDNQTDKTVRQFIAISQSKKMIDYVSTHAKNGEQIVKIPIEGLLNYHDSYTEKLEQPSGL